MGRDLYNRVIRSEETAIICLFLLLAIGLLAPLASNRFLPAAADHANHTAIIVQARMALDEGQFPLKVAPFQHHGWRYPLFQFYSQTPYLLGGLAYKYLTPSNPWLALKLVVFCGLWLAAVFAYKTGQVLGFGRAQAVLMGVAYVTAPYLLVNIHARCAYTEAVAQFFIPAVAWFAIRFVKSPGPGTLVGGVLAWAGVATSHPITLLCLSLFYVGLLLFLYLWRAVTIKRAASLLAIPALGWLVTAFQWYAPFSTRSLWLQSRLGDVFAESWLTPLPTLLSFTSLAPEPLGGLNTPFLHPQIGLVPLFGLCAAVYLLWFRKVEAGDPSVRAIRPCLLMFAVLLFCTWSPVNFWAWLPDASRVLQFSYRLLTYLLVLGTFFFGWSLCILERRGKSLGFLFPLVVLLLVAQGYLPQMERNTRSLESIIAQPDLGYGTSDYLYTTKAYAGPRYRGTLPLVSGDDWLMMHLRMDVDRQFVAENGPALLVLDGHASQSTKPCTTLKLKVGDAVAASREVMPGDFTWQIPLDSLLPFFRHPAEAVGFESSCGFIPKEVSPPSDDSRLLWIRVRRLRFHGLGGAVLDVDSTQPRCTLRDTELFCDLEVPEITRADLPVLYYPDLLSVTLDGREITYMPSFFGEVLLAAIDLPPGRHRVTARFKGSTTGTVLTWCGLLLTALFAAAQRQRHKAGHAAQ